MSVKTDGRHAIARRSPRSVTDGLPILARIGACRVVLAVTQNQLRAAEREHAMAFLDDDIVAARAQLGDHVRVECRLDRHTDKRIGVLTA